MQYYVTQTIRSVHINTDTGKAFTHNQVTHIPCFSLADAEQMCAAMAIAAPNEYSYPHDDNPPQVRAFEVSARVYVNKGSIVLSMAEIEGIAQQYNHPI